MKNNEELNNLYDIKKFEDFSREISFLRIKKKLKELSTSKTANSMENKKKLK